MAGSGIRGQFEEKFKALIKDIEDEVCSVLNNHVAPKPKVFQAGNVICFIDEVRACFSLYSTLDPQSLTNAFKTPYSIWEKPKVVSTLDK